MTICYFGKFDPGYSRNKILIRGLEENGVKVILCYSRRDGYRKYLDMIKKHWQIRNDYDVMVVGFPGWQCMILAWFLTRKKIIFDAFFSIHDAMVCDRRAVKAGSMNAKYLWMIDWLAGRLADKILFDTNEHVKYYIKEFKAKPAKVHRIFVGSDEKVFIPEAKQQAGKLFVVHFHGTYIPLQGIEYIIRAAALLRDENIRINLIGKSQGHDEIVNLAQELCVGSVVNFIDPVSLSELAKYMSMADLCLGVFGISEKTKRVIPNKVYEGVAMKRLILTADTPAIRELFDEESMVFCQAGNGADLAEKIKTIKNNFSEMNKKAEAAYCIFKEKASSRVLGKDLLQVINMQ